MGDVIGWIKKSVGLCASIYLYSEYESSKLFGVCEKEYNEFSLEDKNRIRKILKNQFELWDLIYVLSIFIQKMDILDFGEDIIDCLLEADYDCYNGAMYELQVETAIKGLYHKKRELHKKNVNGYRKSLNIYYEYIPYKRRNKDRILIVTEQVISTYHAPTKIVLDYAKVIKRMGFEVLIVSCPSDLELPTDIWFECKTIASYNNYKNQLNTITYEDTEIDMYQFNMDGKIEENYKKMLDIIHDYNPLFSYNVGVFNPIADLVGDITTVIAKKCSSGLAVSEAEILIDTGHTDDYNFLSFGQTILSEEMGEQYFEDSGEIISRKELYLPDDKFIVTVVGNRLDYECDDAFIDMLKKMIDTIPNLHIAVIGKVEQLIQKIQSEDLQNYVSFLGFSFDLIATYKSLDLYINPKRKGGGYSSLMALVAGIPVVTLPEGDVANNVGNQFVVSDYKQMVEEVKRYAIDKKYYESQMVYVKEIAARKTRDNMEKSIRTRINNMLNLIKKLCDESSEC